jgi:hypothetical protein
MIEEAVFRLFDEVAAKQDHFAIDPLLAELDWPSPTRWTASCWPSWAH